jgi:hypothetical protein
MPSRRPFVQLIKFGAPFAQTADDVGSVIIKYAEVRATRQPKMKGIPACLGTKFDRSMVIWVSLDLFQAWALDNGTALKTRKERGVSGTRYKE